MKIPRYIKSILSRARFAYGYGDPGYTIEVSKETPYTKAGTLEAECKKLVSWVERQMPEDELGVKTALINRVPKQTHYCRQTAVVTIYDPIMKHLEGFIKG